MMQKPSRYKRTMPFSSQCAFTFDDGTGFIERCEAKADCGMYFTIDEVTLMMSLCEYHRIFQESIWIGEKDE